ncbi:MAG: response regulator [Sphingomonadaceae bacterium]
MTGRRILIAEDEPLIAMTLADYLEALGHEVTATVETVGDALARIDEGGFDLAILDVSLKDGERIWPVADKLAAGNLPFILSTGGHVDPPPPEHAGAPVLAKPFTIESVGPAIEAACGG